jgi:hypothetical protein
MRTRIVEVYIGRSFGGDSGDWWVGSFDVPASLPEEEAKQYALDKAREYNPGSIFMGIYCFHCDDMMEGYWEEDDRELIGELDELGGDTVLDEHIHDLCSGWASTVNYAGMDAQIDFLRETYNMSDEDILRMVKGDEMPGEENDLP